MAVPILGGGPQILPQHGYAEAFNHILPGPDGQPVVMFSNGLTLLQYMCGQLVAGRHVEYDELDDCYQWHKLPEVAHKILTACSEYNAKLSEEFEAAKEQARKDARENSQSNGGIILGD